MEKHEFIEQLKELKIYQEKWLNGEDSLAGRHHAFMLLHFIPDNFFDTFTRSEKFSVVPILRDCLAIMEISLPQYKYSSEQRDMYEQQLKGFLYLKDVFSKYLDDDDVPLEEEFDRIAASELSE